MAERTNVLGHVAKIKERDSDNFVNMSEDAGAEGTNKGVSTAGARYSFTPKINLGAINHYGWDTFNTFYAEANGAWDATDRLAIGLSGQYTDQRSIGDELVGAFNTSHFGVKTALRYRGGTLSLAYTETGDGGDIRNPWGGFPGYASLIVQDFDRAGEKTWLAGLSYDFAELGWTGVSASSTTPTATPPTPGRTPPRIRKNSISPWIFMSREDGSKACGCVPGRP